MTGILIVDKLAGWTSQDVAAKLGISNVSKVTNLSAPVVVVLMN